MADPTALSAGTQAANAAPAQSAAAQRAREFFRRFPPHTGPITALQFIERIREKAGLPTEADLEDYVVAGDPTTPVTGIATTAIASLDCLKTAADSGKNLIVTMEPTFWSDEDHIDRLEGNAEFKVKRDFIREHNLVCFHLHEHWPAEGPDGIATGMMRELGWEAYATDHGSPTHFKLPQTTLLGLAKELSTKLNDRTLRVVGDPNLPVVNAVARWGKASQIPTIHLLNEPVDTVLVGYTHEWEDVEYVQDMIAAGEKKSLILMGESCSEQAGMKYCAEWLKTFVTEVPVDFIPVIEPYWNLSQPVSEIRNVSSS